MTDEEVKQVATMEEKFTVFTEAFNTMIENFKAEIEVIRQQANEIAGLQRDILDLKFKIEKWENCEGGDREERKVLKIFDSMCDLYNDYLNGDITG